jgi:hypothetical protein
MTGQTNSETARVRRGQPIDCASCRRRRPHFGRRWCSSCYQRWWRAGKPAGGPPPMCDLSPKQLAAAHAAAALARTARTARRVGRIEDYTWLRGQGATRAEAARRVGVTIRTTQRYDAHLRAQGVDGGESRAA